MKAVIAHEIAGIGAVSIHNDVAWLGHIIVRAKNRGNGIGSLIAQKLIDVAKSKNCTTINLIATNLVAPVYEKIGFKTETKYLFFRNVLIKNQKVSLRIFIAITTNTNLKF